MPGLPQDIQDLLDQVAALNAHIATIAGAHGISLAPGATKVPLADTAGKIDSNWIKDDIQRKIAAGWGITISGTTISATQATFTSFITNIVNDALAAGSYYSPSNPPPTQSVSWDSVTGKPSTFVASVGSVESALLSFPTTSAQGGPNLSRVGNSMYWNNG